MHSENSILRCKSCKFSILLQENFLCLFSLKFAVNFNSYLHSRFIKIQFFHQDMPRASIKLWCNYYLSLESLLKTELLKKMWEILSNDEQTAVITDLRQFIAMSLRGDIDGVVGDFQNALLNNDNGNDNDNHKNDRINDI